VPTNSAYPAGSTILRSIDGVLTIDLKNAENITSEPNKRARIMARAFLTNMKLGKTYGWKIENYPLAEQY